MISDTEIVLDEIADAVDAGGIGGSIPQPTFTWSFRIGAPQVGFVQQFFCPFKCYIVSISCATSSVVVSFDGRATTDNLLTSGGLILLTLSNLVQPMRQLVDHLQPIYVFSAAQAVVNFIGERVDETPRPRAPKPHARHRDPRRR